jgi:hypothetical protein
LLQEFAGQGVIALVESRIRPCKAFVSIQGQFQFFSDAPRQTAVGSAADWSFDFDCIHNFLAGLDCVH